MRSRIFNAHFSRQKYGDHSSIKKITLNLLSHLILLIATLYSTEIYSQTKNCQSLFSAIANIPIQQPHWIDLTKLYTTLAKENSFLSQRSSTISDLHSWRQGGLCGPTCVANIHSAIQIATNSKTKAEAVTAAPETLRKVLTDINKFYGNDAITGTTLSQLEYSLNNLFHHTELYDLVEFKTIKPSSKDWVTGQGVIHLAGVQTGKNQGHAIVIVRVNKKGNMLEATISDPERPNTLVKDTLKWSEQAQSYILSRYGKIVGLTEVKARLDF